MREPGLFDLQVRMDQLREFGNPLEQLGRVALSNRDFEGATGFASATFDRLYPRESPRRQSCRRAVDWKWLSARYDRGQTAKQQGPDRTFIHDPSL